MVFSIQLVNSLLTPEATVLRPKPGHAVAAFRCREKRRCEGSLACRRVSRAVVVERI